MVWYTLFDRTVLALASSSDQNGTDIRQTAFVSAYNIGAPPNGTQLRVTFKAGTGANMNIATPYIGHGAPTGDLTDFDGTQIIVPIGGVTSGVVINGGNTLLSDAVAYNWTKTKPLVVSGHLFFPGNVPFANDVNFYSAGQAGGSPATTDITEAYHFGTNQLCFAPKIEAFFTDPSGNATCTLTKNAGQLDPTSGSTIKLFVQFNKGITGFTASDINLSSSTVTWIGGAPAVSITGSDFAFIVTISGMLTIGDVVASIPAAAVVAQADGAPNTASGVVTVHWDPDIIGDTAAVHEVTAVDRDILRIEVRDPAIRLGVRADFSPGVTGENTFPITGVTNNGYGAIRITVPTAVSNYQNVFISNVTASPISNGAGGFKIRCTVYDTTHPSVNVANLFVQGCLGVLEANSLSPWSITIINSTQFDLNGSTFPTGKTYLGNGFIWKSDDIWMVAAIYGVTGTTEANGAWPMMRSGVSTLDYADSPVFVNAYTGGGTLCRLHQSCRYPNPAKGGALERCQIVGRTGTKVKFQDNGPSYDQYLERNAVKVVANYQISGPGSPTITNLWLKSKPYDSGLSNESSGYELPLVAFRHYIYLKLSTNLTAGTYVLQFPPLTGLPPKTFTYNDKVTRACAIHVDQNGHRPNDPGKLAYLSEWIPEHNVHGEHSFATVTAWHLINNVGVVVATSGAPIQRVGPTTIEGASYDGPQSTKMTPYLVGDGGPEFKVTNITSATLGVVTVDDATGLANGDLVMFTGMWHEAAGRPGEVTNSTGHIGMWQVGSEQGSNPTYSRVVNLSGNTFNLGTCKGVPQGGATIANGGSGYVVGDILLLNNNATIVDGVNVSLEITSVSGGVITGVRVMPNEEWFFELGYAIAQIGSGTGGFQKWNANGSGKIDYPYTIPSNPRSVVAVKRWISSHNYGTGSGTGATFNLTWANNPWDRTTYPGGFPSGNPDTSATPPFYEGAPLNVVAMPFATSIPGYDRGNLMYRVNDSANRADTYVYSLDYGTFTTPGDYRIWLPNIGVSDPIHISESRWWKAARNALEGLYHERQGCTLDGRFGYTKPAGFKPRPGHPAVKSYIPYVMSRYALVNTGPNIPEIGYQLWGGGHGIWIRGGETGISGYVYTTQFGSHQDAGDWDTRLNETCWGYYQILETWARLPSTAKASLIGMGTPTCLEAGLDPVFFAGSDGIPSPLVEVIWGIEQARQAQEPSGAVGAGSNYGEGTLTWECSFDMDRAIYTWYPDPMCTYDYAFVAAKLARCLNMAGFSTLANKYRDSAIAAYDWATLVSTNTTVQDAWWAPVKLRAGWDAGAYASVISSLNAICVQERRVAASALYALTGTTAYRTYIDSMGNVTEADVRRGFGAWEYAWAPFPVDAAIAANTKQLYKTFCQASMFKNMEAPDVSYVCGQSAGIWLFSFGGANTWILNTPCLLFGIWAFEEAGTPTDLADAQKCRKMLQYIAGHRNGANQIGLCMSNGLGVRHNLQTLHLDSFNQAQLLPRGLVSEGWGGNFGTLPLTYGDSQISNIAHPQYEPNLLTVDPTLPWREIFPYQQLSWPRWEIFLEIRQAIEHAEFTTQQQLLPAYSSYLYLHGWDGNAATVTLAIPTVSVVSSLNPSPPATAVTFTCNVSGASGTPTGSVTFLADGVNIGSVTLSSGIAQVTTSSLLEGTHTITASYSGNTTYEPNSASIAQDVGSPLASKVNPRLVMRMRVHA